MSIIHSGTIEIPTVTGLTDFPETVFGTTNEDMIELIGDMKPGEMLLDCRQFWGLRASKGLLASFVETPEDRKGRTHSSHHVRFGQLTLESTSDQELPTKIAIKPLSARPGVHPSAAYALAHEWAANNYVAELSDDEKIFLPLGVWCAADRYTTPQLLTLFDERTQTLDNVFWARGEAADKLTSEMITKALDIALYGLGIKHGAGLSDGDAEIKNSARDNRGIRFVDLESLAFLPELNGHIIDDLRARKAIRGDFYKFTQSLAGVGNYPTVASTKVREALSFESVLHQAVTHYWAGVEEGQLWSGKMLPENLLLQPERFVKLVKDAIDSKDRFWAEKASNLPQHP